MGTAATYKMFDAAEYLKTEADCIGFLEAIIEEGGDAKTFAKALGDIARARGMSQVARDADVARPSLYRALSGEGNPELDTIMRVMKALGLKFSIAPVAPTDVIT